MSCLARLGFRVEVLCGNVVDAVPETDLAVALAGRVHRHGFDPDGGRPGGPERNRGEVAGVPVTIHGRTLRAYDEPDDVEAREFLDLLDRAFARIRPDVLVTYGGDRLTLEVLARARRRGVATVFTLHNFAYPDTAAFADVDAILVPSRFAAEYYRRALGLECIVLPYIVDHDRVRAERIEPNYVTFINPCAEKGVYAFARIADELGRRRPDIPLLVVETRGTERTLVNCGLDLRGHGTVHLMAQTANPRDFWSVTRLALMPSLWWENQPLTAVEAILNGIPVLASDRGGLPETLGGAGLVLPLPDRLTPATAMLPTAEEVAPWVDAIIRLWDDEDARAEHRRLALAEAERWSPDRVEPQYVRFFNEIRPGRTVLGRGNEERANWVVLVPFLHAIEWDCDRALRALEAEGVRVVRCRWASAIDIGRNTLLSEALHRGCDSVLFIDADIGFKPRDALRLLARPEPVVAGVYLKKGSPELACRFPPEIREVHFGPGIPGLYPLDYAPAGFLRIHTAVLRRMIDELSLPLCNTDSGPGFWPFFLPMVVPLDGGGSHYLGEDWAFCHRLRQIGITPMADTSIRLLHIGAHGYTWEDAASPPVRHSHFTYRIQAT